MEWQDISTAPKDRTWIRLYIPAFVSNDCYLNYPAPGQREGYWPDIDGANEWIIPGTMSSDGIHPSHWMLLPSPPKTGD